MQGSVAGVTARMAQIRAIHQPSAGFAAALEGARARASAPPASAEPTAPVAPAAAPAPVLEGSTGVWQLDSVPGGVALPVLPAAAVSRAQLGLPVAGPASGPPVAPPTGVPPTGAGGLTGAAGGWDLRLPEAGRPWAQAIEGAAASAGIDPRLLAALTWQESGFRADAGSHAGAIGLTQLMPGTARGLGVDPHDPIQNLTGGARYLREQLDRFGSVELALAAYNAGPGRVAQAGGIPQIRETQDYVQRVTDNYERLRS